MFKKSKRKIVISIMSILVLLWVGTLGIIYGSSYYEMTKQNRNMLEMHADMYVSPYVENDWNSYEAEINKDNYQLFQNYGNIGDYRNHYFINSRMFQLSIFYSVAITDDMIIEVRNERPAVHSDEELRQLARKIVADDRQSGTENDLMFYATDKGAYRLVVFMDNTIINENVITLLRYTLIFGAVAMVLFFFISIYLAGKIVKPLEENYQKQKQFISDAGHELKTPVAVVSTNAELLSRQIGDNQWLSNIQYENERMGTLVKQLLELARTENVIPKMEQINFTRLCNGEILPFESVAFENGLELSIDISETIMLEGNMSQLKQLVSILIDNAIRHSDSGGEICIKLAKAHGNARLSVINKGNEIPKEQRTRIFERFYRVDTARNGEDKHYGLGLAIAKSIVNGHKGNIEVLCYEGLVEFKVVLPLL